MEHPTSQPRLVGYCLLPFDSPNSVRLQHVHKLDVFTESLGLPSLLELITDRLPPDRRFPREPLFRREGGKRLLNLCVDDHVIFESFAATATMSDLRSVLSTLDRMGVVVHFVDVLDGKPGSPLLPIDGRDAEQRNALQLAIAVWSTMRSVVRWAGPRRRKRKSK
jgi:hypothetical protein